MWLLIYKRIYSIIVLISNLIVNNNNRYEGHTKTGLYQTDSSSWGYKLSRLTFIKNSLKHALIFAWICFFAWVTNGIFLQCSMYWKGWKNHRICSHTQLKEEGLAVYSMRIAWFSWLCVRGGAGSVTDVGWEWL